MLHVLDEKRAEIKLLRYQIQMLQYSTPSVAKRPEYFKKSCPVCSDSIDVGVYDTHICRDGIKSIRCEYCTDSFESIAGALDHLYIYHDDKSLHRCDECSVSFDMEVLYTFHVETNHNRSSITDAEKPIAEIDIKTEDEFVIEVDPIVIKEEPIDFDVGATNEAVAGQSDDLDDSEDKYSELGIASRQKYRRIRSHKCHVCPTSSKTKEHAERHLRSAHGLKGENND